MTQEIKFQDSRIRNFRDFGGYQTIDGRFIKKRIFYRSGALGYIQSKRDREIFKSLHIKTIIDLRSSKERKKLVDPNFNITHYALSAIKDERGKDIDFSPKHLFTPKKIKHFKRKENRTFIQSYFEYFYARLLFGSPAIQTMFDELLEGNVPILIHCSAGKDRTGVLASIILLTLDVDVSTVRDDYLNSTFYRHEYVQKALAKCRRLIKIFPYVEKGVYLSQGVLEEIFELVLSLVHERYQSFDEYIFLEYGIDEDKKKHLQAMYLTKNEE